jgi:glutathione S-transferase
MVTLYHHPFCPYSRFVRLALAEHGETMELIEERPWERREAFLKLNPAGTTPLLVDDEVAPIGGAQIIMEYLDESRGAALGERRLLPSDRDERLEVRRLSSWFHDKFFDEVSGLLVKERIFKRAMPAALGGGPPDSEAIRAARHNIRYHLAYIDWLMRSRTWLAGERLSYADLAAAAHLSIVDYLGDVPWNEDASAKHWYARVKSRPSFRPLLADTVPGVPPSTAYADLDF